MGQILDYIGSIVLAGIVTLIVFTLNTTMTQTAFTRTSEQMSQDAATNMIEILQYDLYKAGYRVSTGQKITVAESLRISFAADIGNTGTPKTITYAVGTTSQLTITPNANDRPLYRTVNSAASVNIVQGLRSCYFAYYDTGGYKMTYSPMDSAKRSLIRGITITATVEPGNPIDTTYIQAKISKAIWPKNLGVW